jgi:branched-chain amino acid transport system substrate-binding protein
MRCIGLVLFLVGVFFCFSNTIQAAEKNEIVIGDVISLTGMAATNGNEASWFFKEAVKDINAQGGIFVKQYNKKLPVKLVTADSESDVGKAVSAAERLIKVDKVDFLLPGCEGVMNLPVAVAADKFKVYFHATTILPIQWRPQKFKWSTLYFFELQQGSDTPFEILTSIPAAERPKKLALLLEDSLDGRNFEGSLKKAAAQYKVEIALTVPLRVNSKDYSAEVLKLKSQGIDGAILMCSNADAITFVRQMKEAQLNLKYLHGYRGTVSTDFWNAVGKDGNYVLCDGFWSDDWPFPRAKEIGERYFKQFGKRSTVGYYYALCQTLWQAIEKAGTLDGATVRDVVMTTQFKGTIMGDVKYGPDGTAIFPAGVLQWWNGERKTVYPFNLSGGWKIKLAPPWDQR